MLDLPDSVPKRIALFALAFAFVSLGVNHFINPEFYVAIMPPYIPAHDELVQICGVFEILGGLGVLISRTRSFAGWGLIALLVAVFPANLHMALNPELFPYVTPAALYVRLPIQFLFTAWAYWATQTAE